MGDIVDGLLASILGMEKMMMPGKPVIGGKKKRRRKRSWLCCV
jgi:hypothetical protein